MKDFITWNEKYNTGNFVIDYQHQRLVRLINDLNDVRQHEELKPSLLSVILDEVENYTQYHFMTEEELMEKIGYSSMVEHKKFHRDFIIKLKEFQLEYSKGSKNIDSEFCKYLKDWLLDHIASEDPKFINEMCSGQGVV